MLARTTTLRHPSGLVIETPVLVPSFSSKGFGESATDGTSEIGKILSAAVEFLTDSMLLSAYDLHHGHIDRITAPITDITILDSGGYETSKQQDLSTLFFRSVSTLPWSREEHLAELEKWPEEIPAMFVTYDDGDERLSLSKQIEAGLTLVEFTQSQFVTFLVRPETENQRRIQMKNLVSQVERLRPFSVIGVTEKELGTSILGRMRTLAELRFALDDVSIQAPIHVFGCLDPVSIPLYFMAGAEIFDGLAWLRFGFLEGVAMYRHNSSAIAVGIDRHDDFVKVKTLQDNLGALIDLRNRMRRFLRDGDYGKFGRHSTLLRESYELLATHERRIA